MNDTLERVLKDFPREGIFENNRLLSIKAYGSSIFGISISKPGPCGDYIANPLLKFSYINGELAYSYFADFAANPIVTIYADDQNTAFFENKMKKLLSIFMQYI